MSINGTSYIEISRSALKQNLDFLRKHLGSERRFSSVVKGNAYGHDIDQFVPLAEEFGVDHFSVFSADEALQVKQASQNKPDIMIMGMAEGDGLEWAIANDVQFFVFNIQRLEQALKYAKKLGKPALVHLDIETGMFRTGLEPHHIKQAIDLIQANPQHLNFVGLCTHYAGAESIANYLRIKKQLILFNKAMKHFASQGMHPQYRHTACSAAAMRYPSTRMDMLRIGILQYGFFPSREVFIEYIKDMPEPHSPLKRILSWKSHVMDRKFVPKGSFIGYGTSYLAGHDMQVASVPVGYSHGFNRSLSNSGTVLIGGQPCSVVGLVNMNMMLVDITHLDQTVKLDDEVVLIGHQGNNEITVAAFTEISSQVNYEMLCRLPRNIPRYVVE